LEGEVGGGRRERRGKEVKDYWEGGGMGEREWEERG
jgi:hypothetical protein